MYTFIYRLYICVCVIILYLRMIYIWQDMIWYDIYIYILIWYDMIYIYILIWYDVIWYMIYILLWWMCIYIYLYIWQVYARTQLCVQDISWPNHVVPYFFVFLLVSGPPLKCWSKSIDFGGFPQAESWFGERIHTYGVSENHAHPEKT
jgi:hypothetical protein